MPRTTAMTVRVSGALSEFGAEGYFFRYERHFVYWRRLSDGDIGIVTILAERMHQMDRFKDEFGGHHIAFV